MPGTRNALFIKIFLVSMAALAGVASLIHLRMVSNPGFPQSRMAERDWADRHRSVLAQPLRDKANIVVIGDSIIQNLEADKAVWSEYFVPYQPLGLGFSGDTTANVLWRIKNGELDNISPKAVVLLVGTNNTRKSEIGWWSVNDDVQAIINIVEAIHQKCPKSEIALVSILPTDQWQWKESKDAEINQELDSRYGEGRYPYVVWTDVHPVFQNADGTLRINLYEGGSSHVHPNQEGDRALSQAILKELRPFLFSKESSGGSSGNEAISGN